MHVLRSEEKNSIVFIGLGSNVGNRQDNLKKSIEHLRKNSDIAIIAVSLQYDTEAFGYKEQPRFLNAVMKITTTLDPYALLNELKKTERLMGRKNGKRWGPRIIDLDILFYSNQVIECKELTIPHPNLHMRWFVLKPMSDIEPDFEHPIFQKTMRQLLEELNG